MLAFSTPRQNKLLTHNPDKKPGGGKDITDLQYVNVQGAYRQLQH